jgi:thiol-disulfide isomerase/thioredoxin
MKKISIGTVFIVGALCFLAYKLTRRFLIKPTMQFESAVLVDIETNDTFSIQHMRGQVLMISCFQTWCGDCARETVDLDHLANSLSSPLFSIVYISDESKEKILAFKKRFGSQHIRFAQTSQRLNDWGIHAYPTTFLLNKKGMVVKTKQEGYSWSNDDTEIRTMLAE